MLPAGSGLGGIGTLGAADVLALAVAGADAVALAVVIADAAADAGCVGFSSHAMIEQSKSQRMKC